MYSDGSALTQLPRADCLKLMASVSVGRVIYTRRALPAVELVSFTFDAGDIVLRTDPSGKLAAAARGAVVAFEADWVDLDQQVGWSGNRHRALACGDRSGRGPPAEGDRPLLVDTRRAGSLHPDLAGDPERQVPAGQRPPVPGPPGRRGVQLIIIHR